MRIRSALRRLTCVLIILAHLFIYTPVTAEDSSFAIHFLDVGQGLAAIVLCDGEVMMFDGGDSASSSLVFSYLRNTLGIRHIDTMVASHPHDDHVGGLSGALNACSVGTIYSPVTEYDNKQFSSLLKYAGKQGVSLTVPAVGDTFTIGTATATFLSPAKEYTNMNDLSLVVRIQYGDTSFLLTGDAEWEAEHDMVASGADLSSTLLSVGHHGSDTSSSYVFLREVMPEYAVISVGQLNPYGHPTEDVLSRLKDADAQVYRTDLQGTIVCESDGHSLSFTTEKQVPDPAALYAPSAAPMLFASLTTPKMGSDDYLYVLNTNSHKFHLPSCSSVAKMQDKHRSYSSSSPEELVAQGYDPCGQCTPYTVPSTPAPTHDPSKAGTDYVLNKNSKKFHYLDCKSVKKMKESNKEYYTGTRDDLIKRGYDPCGNCNP